MDQTKERYNLVSDDILKSESDLVCLQECDIGFFESDFNDKADKPTYNRIDNLDALYLKKQSGGGLQYFSKK